jgi:hypothetical protein
MTQKIEEFIKAVYQNWRSHQPQPKDGHPDEETLACFLEGRLSEEDAEILKAHLINCPNCSEAFALNLKADALEDKPLPQELLTRLKNLLPAQDKASLLEIALQFKDKAIEIINTTGAVLFGQELVPAAVLRSRKIKEFKDEVIILKDFKDITVEIRVENKSGRAFDLRLSVKQKQSQKPLKDLRVTLFKEDLELESYLADSGSVAFEHVLLGKYKIEINSLEAKVAVVILDIKI